MKIPEQILRAAAFLRTEAPKHPRALLGGGLVAICIGYSLFSGSPDGTRVLVHHEGIPDFTNSSILGHPHEHILAQEQTQLAKKEIHVLSVETQLQTQLNTAMARIAALEGRASQPETLPSPMMSGSSAPIFPGTQSRTGALQPEVYGPLEPGPSTAPIHFSPSTEKFGSTAVEDKLTTSRAAETPGPLDRSDDAPISRRSHLGNNVLSFPAKPVQSVVFKTPSIILPTGSYVKGKLLTGVEAPEGKTYPVLLQLDYAYITPNDKRLDLTGCFMIAKATGNLSTERVEMQPTKLSCVSKRGGMFEREVNGFVADDVDNSFAVIGTVNTKQDRVAAMAFLASVAAGVGKAIQTAQTTQQTTPLGGSQTVLTGDTGKFIAAGGASDAATMVANWYLKHAEALLPTINVGSGQNVWMVMTEQVDLPREYFNQNKQNGGITHDSLFSVLTRVID